MKLSLLFTLLISVCWSQQEQFFVNPVGHKSQIRDVAVSKDQKYIITASFDKTIKKWDLATGEIVMEYRSKIGPGFEGAVYYIELAPNNQFLAAGGWFGLEDETENLGDIRLFDYQTGEVIRVLKGLGSPPRNINISADSKYVIAGDEYSKIYKWDAQTGQLLASFDFHRFEEGKKLLNHESNGKLLMSVDEAGVICFWDINNPDQPIKIDKKTVPMLMKKGMKNVAFEVSDLALSPTNEDFAFSLESLLVIYDKNFKPYAFIPNETKPGFLKFSADGKRLLTGCIDRGQVMHAKVYEKNQKQEWLPIADFDTPDGSMICGDFINDTTYVTPGGYNNYIYVWSLQKDSTNKQKLLAQFTSNGFTPYAAGLANGIIAFADVWTENMGNSTFNKEFDLFMKSIKPYQTTGYTRPVTVKDDYSIKWCRTHAGSDGIQAGLEIKKGNQVIDTLKRNEYNGSRHTAYTITPNKFIISGGNYGYLEAYDLTGTLVNRFVGHTDLIQSVAISNDQKRLITSSADNTIRIWDIQELGKFQQNQAEKSVYEYMNEQRSKYPILFDVLDKKVKELGIETLYTQRSIDAWQNFIQKIDQTDLKEYYHENLSAALEIYRVVLIYPIVSIFMTTEGEWIIWNEKGYYSASKKGAQYVGYYVNKGKDESAKFYPFEQFDLKYNRPDIILEELDLGSEKIRNFYYKAYQKRLQKMGLSEEQLNGDLHLPLLSIKNQSLAADKKTIEISFEAFDSKYKIERIAVFINDVPIYGSKGIKVNNVSKIAQTIKLDLADGKNKIQLSALNDKGVESLKENLVVFNPSSVAKPNLYLVTIGTSLYQDKRFNLKYAAKDAQDILEKFKKDQVYQAVFTEVLLDQQSTKENIQKLKNFLLKSTQNDVVMVFVAGHGLLDENFDYYYATHDIDFNSPKLKGMLFTEIAELLDGIGALKKILFMDTCHSGEVDKEDLEKENDSKKTEEDVQFRSVGQSVRKKEGVGLENTSELVKEMFVDLRRGTGSTVLSSAGGAEYALESDTWKNGLFTYCLLSGITTLNADLNHDGKIMLSEMQVYVREEVLKLSGGKQQPTSRLENLSLDYPIWVQ